MILWVVQNLIRLLALFDILARPLAESVLTSLRAVSGLYFYYVFVQFDSWVACVLRWSPFILNQPSRISAKRSNRVASVLWVEVHFDLRYSAVTFGLCLSDLRLAFALFTCAFWICHTFPWFVRVHFRKYCLFRSSQFAIVQPYRSSCVLTVECPC